MFDFRAFLSKGLVDGVRGGQTRYALTMRAASLVEKGLLDTADLEPLAKALDDGATVYYKLATPVIYNLGKLDIPSLPETISNVLVEANLTPECAMTYKRDINVAFENLAQAVVAAAAGE